MFKQVGDSRGQTTSRKRSWKHKTSRTGKTLGELSFKPEKVDGKKTPHKQVSGERFVTPSPPHLDGGRGEYLHHKKSHRVARVTPSPPHLDDGRGEYSHHKKAHRVARETPSPPVLKGGAKTYSAADEELVSNLQLTRSASLEATKSRSQLFQLLKAKMSGMAGESPNLHLEKLTAERFQSAVGDLLSAIKISRPIRGLLRQWRINNRNISYAEKDKILHFFLELHSPVTKDTQAFDKKSPDSPTPYWAPMPSSFMEREPRQTFRPISRQRSIGDETLTQEESKILEQLHTHSVAMITQSIVSGRSDILRFQDSHTSKGVTPPITATTDRGGGLNPHSAFKALNRNWAYIPQNQSMLSSQNALRRKSYENYRDFGFHFLDSLKGDVLDLLYEQCSYYSTLKPSQLDDTKRYTLKLGQMMTRAKILYGHTRTFIKTAHVLERRSAGVFCASSSLKSDHWKGLVKQIAASKDDILAILNDWQFKEAHAYRKVTFGLTTKQQFFFPSGQYGDGANPEHFLACEEVVQEMILFIHHLPESGDILKNSQSVAFVNMLLMALVFYDESNISFKPDQEIRLSEPKDAGFIDGSHTTTIEEINKYFLDSGQSLSPEFRNLF